MSMENHQRHDRITGGLLLGLGLVLIWAPFIARMLAGKTAAPGLLEHDLGAQWIPFREYARAALAQGYFPLWCPDLFAGMPFLAFSHTQTLYPFSLIFNFLDYAQAVNLYYPFHISIGFLGLYLLITNLGVSRFASFVVALSTALSGKFLYFIHFIPIAGSNFWAIWFFYFLVKLTQNNFKESRLKALPHQASLFGLAIALALEILGGDIESATYQLFFTPFFLLILLRRDKKILSPVWLLLILGTLLGILIALAQFLPLFEYSHFFLRSAGYTFQKFESRTLPWKTAGALLFPVKDLATTEFTSPAPYLYLGLIGIFFPFYALLFNRKNLGLFALAIFVLLFSFGSLKPLDWIIYHIPFLNRYSTVERSFFIFQIFWAVLTGLGIDQALKDRKGLTRFFAFSLVLVFGGQFLRDQLGLRLTLIFLFAFFLPGLLVLSRIDQFSGFRKLGAFLLLLVFLLDLYELFPTTFPKNSPDQYRLPQDLAKFEKLAGDKGFRAVAVSSLGVKDPELPQQFGLRVKVGTIDGWVTTPPLDYAKFLNLLDPRSLTLKDGKIEDFGFNTVFRDGKFVQAQTLPLLDLLSLKYFLVRDMNLKLASPYALADAKPNTVYLEKEDELKTEIRNPAKEAAFALILFENQQEHRIIYARALPPGVSRSVKINLESLAGKTGALDLIGPEMTWRDPRIENPLRPIQRISKDEIEILENREAFPQAFIVHNCKVIASPKKTLEGLKESSQWDVAKELILSRESATAKIVQMTGRELQDGGIDPFKLKEPAPLIEQTPDSMTFRAYLLYPGYLFLNHQYLPGWRAYVDGKEWPIEKADYCFRAVFLEPGDHRVVFRYQPRSFRIGLWFSLATILAFLIAGIALWKMKRPRRFDSIA